MLKIAVCDDEVIICHKITELLKSLHKDFELFEFHSGDKLIESLSNFDVVILDIEMPGENGMNIAKKIRQSSTDILIIFLTNHSEFIHTAFKVKAFRYLNKPIMEEDFFEAIIAAEKEILNIKSIILKIQGHLTRIKLKDIIYLEAFGDGTYIYTVNGVYTSGKQLNYLISLLKSDMFFHVHKSFLVSFNHIQNISDFEIQMINGKGNIPISRRKAPIFKKEYLTYIKNNCSIL